MNANLPDRRAPTNPARQQSGLARRPGSELAVASAEIDTELAGPSIERAASDPESARRLGGVAAGLAQRALEGEPLVRFQ